MKRFVLDFLRRGFFACGFGPMVLTVVYLILHRCGVLETLTVYQVCVGIVSLTGLAFVAGGMNAVYQIALHRHTVLLGSENRLFGISTGD